MTRDALFLPIDDYQPDDFRLQLAALALADGGITTHTGVLPGGTSQLAVVAYSPAQMAVHVNSGRCIIQGSQDPMQGAYLWTCEGERLDLEPADPVHDRIDRIVVRVRDSAYGSTTDNDSFPDAITGTPSATPDIPGPPANWTTLAYVNVPAGATSIHTDDITDRRAYTVAAGGILPVTHTRYSSSPYKGLTVYDLDIKDHRAWNGDDWVPLANSQIVGLSGRCVGTVATPDPATNVTWEQAGTSVLTTNGAGGFVIGLPETYETGLITVLFSPGDTTGNLGSIVALNSNHTLDAIQGIALSRTGSPLASTLIRINWLTKGW